MAIRFRDFVNDRGDNVIYRWLHGELGEVERNKVNSILEHLEAQKSLTGSPFAHRMKGTDGIFEVIIKVAGRAYRPLFCYGPDKGEATLLVGVEKKNNRLIPPDALRTAEIRKSLVLSRRSVTVEHDVS